MWSLIGNVVARRSRSLDDDDVLPKYSQTRTSLKRSLAELEQDCRRIVSATGVDVRLRLGCCSTRLDLDLDPAGRQQYVSRATTSCFGFVESDRHAKKTYPVSREPAVLSARACQEFQSLWSFNTASQRYLQSNSPFCSPIVCCRLCNCISHAC